VNADSASLRAIPTKNSERWSIREVRPFPREHGTGAVLQWVFAPLIVIARFGLWDIGPHQFEGVSSPRTLGRCGRS
jgi:hypothetical protein